MRSALKRDLDAHIFLQPVDESDASGENVVRPAANLRAARPRIVESDAPEIRAPKAAAQPPAVEAPTPAADALLGDLKRIMASLDASRAAEKAVAPPQAGQRDVVTAASAPAVQAPAPSLDSSPDGKPLGTVAAAALRAFREAERGQRTVPGLGARLLAAEAERIAAEREVSEAPFDHVVPDLDQADPLFSTPDPAGEPYVYGSSLQAPVQPAYEGQDFEARDHEDWTHEVPAHDTVVNDAVALEAPVDELPAHDAGFEHRDADPAVAPAAGASSGRDWLALPDDEFAPPRYRAEAAAPRAGKGFAFDIHAFVDELEREAADAGRDWGAREGDALFAKDRAPKEPAASKPVAKERSTVEPLPFIGEPAPLSGEVDLLPPAVEPAFRHREPRLPGELVPHAPVPHSPVPHAPLPHALMPDTTGEEPAPSVAVRRTRTRRDTFTWKRLALLGVIIAVAGGGAVKLQSIAARNDAGEAVAEAGATDAAVASVAPHEDAVVATVAPVRNVTPQLGGDVAGSEPAAVQPVEVASAAPADDVTPTLRPSDAAQTALSGAIEPDRTDRTPDATDETAAAAPADAAMDAPMEEMGDAAPTSDSAVEEPVAAAPEQAAPVVDAPAPQPRPVQVAAVAPRVPAPSGAVPSGTATIKSGVTLRAGADNKAAALGTLKTGQKVDLVACKLWCEIVADGKRGFVFKKFVEAGTAQ